MYVGVLGSNSQLVAVYVFVRMGIQWTSGKGCLSLDKIEFTVIACDICTSLAQPWTYVHFSTSYPGDSMFLSWEGLDGLILRRVSRCPFSCKIVQFIRSMLVD